jgi:hypothetical protein
MKAACRQLHDTFTGQAFHQARQVLVRVILLLLLLLLLLLWVVILMSSVLIVAAASTTTMMVMIVLIVMLIVVILMIAMIVHATSTHNITVSGDAIVLITPAVECARRQDHGSMPRSAGNQFHVLSNERLDAFGRARSGFIAVSEFPVHASTPSPTKGKRLMM